MNEHENQSKLVCVWVFAVQKKAEDRMPYEKVGKAPVWVKQIGIGPIQNKCSEYLIMYPKSDVQFLPQN